MNTDLLFFLLQGSSLLLKINKSITAPGWHFYAWSISTTGVTLVASHIKLGAPIDDLMSSYNLSNAHLWEGGIQRIYYHLLRRSLCDRWIRRGPIVGRRCFHIPLLSYLPIFLGSLVLHFSSFIPPFFCPILLSFYHTHSISLSSFVLLSCSLSLSPFVCHNFVHVRNQYSWGVTHTSTATFWMKRGRSGARHAIAPQATAAWQVIHLLDLIAQNKGHIRVVPHLSSGSLLEGSAAESSALCLLLRPVVLNLNLLWLVATLDMVCGSDQVALLCLRWLQILE